MWYSPLFVYWISAAAIDSPAHKIIARARRGQLEDVQGAGGDRVVPPVLRGPVRGRDRRLPVVYVALGRGRAQHPGLRAERPLGGRGRVHGRGVRRDAPRARRRGRDRRALGAAPALRRDRRDGRAAVRGG